MKGKPTASTGKGPALRIGEVAVCAACLRTTFERAETASRRCRCGGRIIAMPRSEVDARRRDKA
jgi:DNA-directed RNA polymerase subunit RPC12/RpoP